MSGTSKVLPDIILVPRSQYLQFLQTEGAKLPSTVLVAPMDWNGKVSKQAIPLMARAVVLAKDSIQDNDVMVSVFMTIAEVFESLGDRVVGVRALRDRGQQKVEIAVDCSRGGADELLSIVTKRPHSAGIVELACAKDYNSSSLSATA